MQIKSPPLSWWAFFYDHFLVGGGGCDEWLSIMMMLLLMFRHPLFFRGHQWFFLGVFVSVVSFRHDLTP